MAQAKRYEDLVAQAEKAVTSVKDPELKRAAFEKVLDDLLASAEPAQSKTRARSQGKSAAPKDRGAKGARGPSGYIQELIEDAFFRKPKTISQAFSKCVAVHSPGVNVEIESDRFLDLR